MTTPTLTSSIDSQMHNNIMAASSRDHPPMLTTGRYPQWRSRFLRYIDTRPNGKALRKCILSGPYKPTTVLVQAVEATDDSPAILKHTTVETPMNILARKANPLALVATAQANQDPYYQTSKSHKSYAPSSKPLIPTKSHTTTRYKGKKIAKPITPPSVIAFEEDMDPEQAQMDKDMQKNLALIAKNQRTVNVAGAKEKVGSPVVQQSGIQCFNCKEFGHFAKECKKPKMVKDFAYHKEKMLLCKQAEQGVSLQAEQYDWLSDTDEEVDEHELEAHYSYMAKIQEVPTADSGIDSEPLEQNDQNDIESDDERVVLETSKSLGESISVRDSCLVALQNKQTEFEKYKAFNDRTIDYDKLERKLNEALGQLAPKDIEIKEGLKTKAYELSVVKEKHKSHYEGLVKQKTKVITDLKLREEHDIEKMLSMENN
nr:hypothetical protein [Tanacetum cinerariifolium]